MPCETCKGELGLAYVRCRDCGLTFCAGCHANHDCVEDDDPVDWRNVEDDDDDDDRIDEDADDDDEEWMDEQERIPA
jgi:hypothetical protein